MRAYYDGKTRGREWMRTGRGKLYIEGLVAFRRFLGDEGSWLRWLEAQGSDVERRIVVEAFSRSLGLPIDPRDFWLDVARHIRMSLRKPLSWKFIRGFCDGALVEHEQAPSE